MNNSLTDIKNLIKSKKWYSFDTPAGAFSWPKSVANLADFCHLATSQVNQAITDSFTPDCLTKLTIVQKKQQVTIPLLQALHDLHLNLYIWTMGDKKWQYTKFHKSGAYKYILPDQYISSATKKEEKLNIIIKQLNNLNQQTRKKQHLIIVDDKISNLDKTILYLASGNYEFFTYSIYHFKLNNPKANSTAFYYYIKELKNAMSDTDLTLVLDFDGVVADTDSVLFNRVPEAIARLLKK